MSTTSKDMLEGAEKTHALATEVAALDLVQLSHFLASLHEKLKARSKNSTIPGERLMCYVVAQNLVCID